MDLTGYSALLQFKEKSTSPNSLQEFTDSSGHIVLGSDGTIVIVIPPEETIGFKWKSVYYDLSITEPSGDTNSLLFGRIRAQG